MPDPDPRAPLAEAELNAIERRLHQPYPMDAVDLLREARRARAENASLEADRDTLVTQLAFVLASAVQPEDIDAVIERHAAEVDDLRAEAARLTEERDAWRELARPKQLLSDNWRSEELLEAEVAELRAARSRTARLFRLLWGERDAKSSALDALAVDYADLERERDRLRAARSRVVARLRAMREARGLLEDTVETWKEMYHEVAMGGRGGVAGEKESR